MDASWDTSTMAGHDRHMFRAVGIGLNIGMTIKKNKKFHLTIYASCAYIYILEKR